MTANGTQHEKLSARAVLSSATVSSATLSSEKTLLLASASPRRAHILQTLGIPFQVVRSAFEEPPPSREDHAQPAQFVERLAREKAHAALVDAALVDAEEEVGALVLAADTIVWLDGEILGKPRDANHAISMLQRLRGHQHRVLTGVCLRWNNNGDIEYSTAHETTIVRFNEVSDEWIRAYVATGEPLDKAGSYGAQDKGALLVRFIEGDFWNVVGLPLAPLSKLLNDAGAPIEKYWKSCA